jgi:hypothetical protein
MRLVEYPDSDTESEKSPRRYKQCKSRTSVDSLLRLNPDTKIQKAKAKQLYELIRKRRETVFRKAEELRCFGNVDIYILIGYKGKLFTYTSTERSSWPPTKEQIVRVTRRLL